jgi:hypothetical protein
MGVFISYANEDEDAVRALATDLRRARQTVWLDQDLHGGDTWWQTILKQIQDADVFIFALSNNSQRSKPCRAELEYARALSIPVLPVQIGPVDSLRSTFVADLQIVDYRQRNADAALSLIAALQEATVRRGPLPEPLPDQPPIPFEYLMRLGRAIDAPQMNPSEQVGVLAQLRQGLEDEDDANARQDIAMLLQNMRRRPDATYRSVSEIDALLATIDQAPPTEPETPARPFSFHGVSIGRYASTGTTMEEKTTGQGPRPARDRARPKANRRTARFELLPFWFLGLWRQHQEPVRWAPGKQDTTDTQSSIGPTDRLGRGRVTGRQIVLAASAAAVIILLIIALTTVNTRPGSTSGPWKATIKDAGAYVYRSPTLEARQVSNLNGGAEVAIQCIAQGDTAGASNRWYRIEDGYIPELSVNSVRGTTTIPNC